MVNSWLGEAVHRAGLVKVRVVNTHAPLAVRLGDHDDVGDPCRVGNFPDEFDFLEPLNLGLDSSILVWVEGTSLLFDRGWSLMMLSLWVMMSGEILGMSA